eukprot:3930443-Amphidinium_carterae.1
MAAPSYDMVEDAASQYPSPWTGKTSATLEHHTPDVYKMLQNFRASVGIESHEEGAALESHGMIQRYSMSQRFNMSQNGSAIHHESRIQRESAIQHESTMQHESVNQVRLKEGQCMPVCQHSVHSLLHIGSRLKPKSEVIAVNNVNNYYGKRFRYGQNRGSVSAVNATFSRSRIDTIHCSHYTWNQPNGD